MQAIDKEYYPELLEIVNETYTDRLERLLVAEMDDDGTIKAIGQDGQKQIGVIIGEDIKIKELKRGTTTINFASPKKCIKGLSCGGACISRGSLCHKALTPKQAAKVAELKKRIGKGDAKAKGQLDAFKKDRVEKYDGAIKREVMRMIGITKAQDEAIGPKSEKSKKSVRYSPQDLDDMEELPTLLERAERMTRRDESVTAEGDIAKKLSAAAADRAEKERLSRKDINGLFDEADRIMNKEHYLDIPEGSNNTERIKAWAKNSGKLNGPQGKATQERLAKAATEAVNKARAKKPPNP